MNKLDLKKMGKMKPNPLFKGMSGELKDPKNYKKIEKRLAEILKTDHKHKTVTSYAKCEKCQINRMERQSLMKKEGFKSIQQYMEWKKIMVIMVTKTNFALQ